MSIPSRFFLAAGLGVAASLSPLRAVEGDAAARPHILGVAQIGLYVHDIDAARRFYHDFLGYDESATLRNPDGSLRAVLIRINEQQSVELLPERAPATDRLDHIALETDDVEGMRRYLHSKGVNIVDRGLPGAPDPAGFRVEDPDGHAVGFLPPSICPFQRQFVGDALTFPEAADGDTLTIQNSERHPDVPRLTLSSDEYLLLENRYITPADSVRVDQDSLTTVILGPKEPDRFEYDALLPGSGILVWHIDESVIPFTTSLRFPSESE